MGVMMTWRHPFLLRKPNLENVSTLNLWCFETAYMGMELPLP
jgi:hypothetical protein